jgi:hypothetical protein
VAWTVDTRAPDTRALAILPSAAQPTGAVTFASTEPGSRYECRRGAGAWSPCASPLAAGAGADLGERPVLPAAPAETAPAPRPPETRAPVRPPSPAPDPAEEIRSLFAEYGAAIEARSVEAIRRTYPGLLPDQARVWEDFFRGVTDVDVELNVTGLEVAGNAAEARLSGVYVFTNPSTRRTQRENVAFQASLRREGGGWRIASLR